MLAELGLELPGGNKPEPRDYAELLESVADRPDAEMLQTMLLRSMKQAIYDPENRGHFGLALQSYAHFTSPIRRYPDLTLHRAIKYLLAKEQGHQGNTTETAWLPLFDGRDAATGSALFDGGTSCRRSNARCG